MYATYVTLNYVVQLTAVIPYAAPNPVLVQTPHSLFWTVDALGYIALGLATLFAVPLFAKQGRQKWVRWFFSANGLIIPQFVIVYFYPNFSTTLLLLGLPWIVTAPGSMLLLALFFRSGSELWKQDSLSTPHMNKALTQDISGWCLKHDAVDSNLRFLKNWMRLGRKFYDIFTILYIKS